VLVHSGNRDWATAGRTSGGTDTSSTLGKVVARLGGQRFEAFTPGPDLCDGDVLPVNGLRVVHTPGHSPDMSHCSWRRPGRS
jgi:glyoxylase-like metal-dependent hydrolase (beta-lactamase superfamily II)